MSVNKMLTTDWGSYYVPVDMEQQFNDDLNFENMGEELFDTAWGQYKILPLCSQRTIDND